MSSRRSDGEKLIDRMMEKGWAEEFRKKMRSVGVRKMKPGAHGVTVDEFTKDGRRWTRWQFQNGSISIQQPS